MKRKQRRKIGKEYDRIMFSCSEETGNRIRELADSKGVTISKLVGDIVESALDRLEEGGNQ